MQQVLLENCAEHTASANEVVFCLHPSMLYAMNSIKKDKAVKLLPFGFATKAEGSRGMRKMLEVIKLRGPNLGSDGVCSLSSKRFNCDC